MADKSQKCEFCGVMFQNKTAVLSHIRYKHPDMASQEESNSQESDQIPTQENTQTPTQENPTNNTPFTPPIMGVMGMLPPKTNPQSSTQESKSPKIKKPYKVVTKISVPLSGEQSHIVENLVNQGLGSDAREIVEKGLELLNSTQIGGSKNMNSTESMSQLMENIARQQFIDMQTQLYQAQIEEKLNKMKKDKDKGGNTMEASDLILIMALTGGLGGNKQQQDPNTNILQTLEVLDRLRGNNNQNQGSNLKDTIELMKMIQPPQQTQPQGISQEYLLKLLLERKNEGTNVKDIIKELRGYQQEAVQKDAQFQKLQYDNDKKFLEMKIDTLQRNLETLPKGTDKFNEVRETIATLKELNNELGTTNAPEKSPGLLDYMESLGKNFGPAITEIIKAKTGTGVVRGSSRFEEEDEEADTEMTAEQVREQHRAKHNIQPQVRQVPQVPQQPAPSPQQVMHQRVNTTQAQGGFFSEQPKRKSLTPETPPELPSKKEPMSYIG